jgi:hypothetical protein
LKSNGPGQRDITNLLNNKGYHFVTHFLFQFFTVLRSFRAKIDYFTHDSSTLKIIGAAMVALLSTACSVLSITLGYLALGTATTGIGVPVAAMLGASMCGIWGISKGLSWINNEIEKPDHTRNFVDAMDAFSKATSSIYQDATKTPPTPLHEYINRQALATTHSLASQLQQQYQREVARVPITAVADSQKSTNYQNHGIVWRAIAEGTKEFAPPPPPSNPPLGETLAELRYNNRLQR